MGPKISSIVQTCVACPSQWEGLLDDGRCFYIRYRWGHLSVRVSETKTLDMSLGVVGKEVFSSTLSDDPLEGWIDLQTVMTVTNNVLNWDGV